MRVSELRIHRVIRNCRNRWGDGVKLSIETNFRDVARQLKTLQQDIATKATASALNKVVAQAKTAMGREITREFNLPAAEVREKLRIRRATARGGLVAIEAVLEASRKAKGRGLNLIRFLEKSTSLAQARNRGKAGTLNQLHVQIKRTGGRKALGSAFIGNKGRTVFVREGKARLPIKALTTIDVAQMFNTKRINAKVVQLIQQRFPAIFSNEVRFFTARFNAGR